MARRGRVALQKRKPKTRQTPFRLERGVNQQIRATCLECDAKIFFENIISGIRDVTIVLDEIIRPS